jgi:hypothetical protein
MCWSGLSGFIQLCIGIQIIWTDYSALAGIPHWRRGSRQKPGQIVPSVDHLGRTNSCFRRNRAIKPC